MVAPNDHVLDILNRNRELVTELRKSTVLIESSHGSEVLLWNGGSIVRSDESIGISRVANNKDLHILLGKLVKSLTLSLENLGVRIEKILAFHAGSTWHSTN